MKIFYFVKKIFREKWHNLFAIFIRRYMDLLWIWNRKKKNKIKQDIKYYYKNKENNIRFIAEILILS